ncbi:MAG: hypothetical protein JXA54_11610 [Candidatus Heimdallarchaeota archaeon]|nr:hypothetical protein [Candidatus Heimdallarchaeota archaeon]
MELKNANSLVGKLDGLTKLVAVAILTNAQKIDYKEFSIMLHSIGLSKEEIRLLYNSAGIFDFLLPF